MRRRMILSTTIASIAIALAVFCVAWLGHIGCGDGLSEQALAGS